MQQQIPIRDINQHLSRYIDIVENGSEIIITRRGKPVARLTSVTEPQPLTKKQQATRQRTLARMNQGFELGGKVFDKDASHER